MFPTGNLIADPIIWALLSMWVIFRASDSFETASEYIGRNLRDGVRGATINAIASSIPELLTTIFFLLYLSDEEGFASGIGTTAGSAIFNGMVIPAAVIMTVLLLGVATRITVSRKVLLRDGLALIICEIMLILIIRGSVLDWWHGLLLMLVYFSYVIFMIRTMKRGDAGDQDMDDDVNPPETARDDGQTGRKGFWRSIIMVDLDTFIIGERKINAKNAWLLLLASTLVIGAACFLLVVACEKLGAALNFPVYFIAVILAAAATSIPDTLISIKDGMRGNYDDAISNALGSNIFDICFALGFPLFLYCSFEGPIFLQRDSEIGELRILLLFLTIAALLIYLVRRYMTMLKAVFLLTIYAFFVLFIIGKSTGNEAALSISVFIQNVLGWIN